MGRPNMQKQPAETYKVILGSNVISNCGQVLSYQGKGELLRLRDGKDMKLLVDCAVKDSSGHTLAKIANNKPVFVSGSCLIDEFDDGLIVKDKDSGDVYLEFRQLGPRELKVNGIFFINGVRLIATDDFLDVGGMRLSHCSMDNCGSAIGIGP